MTVRPRPKLRIARCSASAERPLRTARRFNRKIKSSSRFRTKRLRANSSPSMIDIFDSIVCTYQSNVKSLELHDLHEICSAAASVHDGGTVAIFGVCGRKGRGLRLNQAAIRNARYAKLTAMVSIPPVVASSPLISHTFIDSMSLLVAMCSTATSSLVSTRLISPLTSVI